jgi:hypothetical protein
VARPADLEVSRYQDIKAALVDPRRSAKTLPEAIMPKDAENKIPVVFAQAMQPARPLSWHLFGPVDMSLKPECVRHVSVAIT